MAASMAEQLPPKRRSIAHRASVAVPTHVIDLTMDSPVSCAAQPAGVEPKKLYDELKEIEDSVDVIRNMENFFCTNCFEIIDVYDGLCLRNCLHQICITCARGVIFNSHTVDVKCPIDNCELIIQDREVRGLLTQQEYTAHVNRSAGGNGEQLYTQLMELEEQTGYVTNLTDFECEICYTEIGIGDGVMIRECLHQFCIDCVRGTVTSSEEAVVKCPAATCECIIQDRGIRSLLTQSEFDKYTQRTLRIAESTEPNSFHCKKANCEGWAICDENVLFFKCRICSSNNCLTCRVIHEGKNCKEYQDELKYAGMTDDQRSEMKLDEIVNQNLGMRCPSCKIVIMKREGCDWLSCSMCKTEICWATKQNRWGPGGRGDTSGGCKCTKLKKCHQNCHNCH